MLLHARPRCQRHTSTAPPASAAADSRSAARRGCGGLRAWRGAGCSAATARQGPSSDSSRARHLRAHTCSLPDAAAEQQHEAALEAQHAQRHAGCWRCTTTPRAPSRSHPAQRRAQATQRMRGVRSQMRGSHGEMRYARTSAARHAPRRLRAGGRQQARGSGGTVPRQRKHHQRAARRRRRLASRMLAGVAFEMRSCGFGAPLAARSRRCSFAAAGRQTQTHTPHRCRLRLVDAGRQRQKWYLRLQRHAHQRCG